MKLKTLHNKPIISALLALAFASIASIAPFALADWPTHRGSPQRTGTQDKLHLPIIQKPKILWAYKAQEHFVASPVPEKNLLFVSGLGAFNTAQFHAVATEDSPASALMPATKRGMPVWSKASPFIKLPTVSPPAVYDNLVIFGDGLHQTDGAILYAFDLPSGRPLWRFENPGKLVHMEGSPLVDPNFPGGPAVFIGAGDGGIIALSTHQASVNIAPPNKPLRLATLDLPRLRALMDQRWLLLQKKYDNDKLKDGELAIPPSEESLPQATPQKLWQVGEKTWHVDAALALVGEKILLTSSFLEEDKVGKRVAAAIDKKTGKTLWETPLDINPWSGCSIDGNIALIGCSSIRFDRNLVDQGKGQLVALDVETGAVKWKKDISGGVLSSVAVKDGLAVITTTNGRVRAFNTATGEQKWSYASKSGFFAGAAITPGADAEKSFVYAADLDGVLHALRLADGELLWTFDVGRAPQVNAPGMFFGSPVVHNGAIYLATCNIAGPNAQQPCAAVCLVDQSFKSASERPQLIVEKSPGGAGGGGGKIILPSQAAPRKLATLKEIYPHEIVASNPAPQGQKAHETVVVSDVLPSELHKALVSLGATPGKPVKGDGTPTGTQLKISFVFTGPAGKSRTVPIEQTILDKRTGKTLPPLKWFFTGSVLRRPDPDKPDTVYGADLSGTFISIFPVTDELIIQSDLPDETQSFLKLEINPNIVPEELTSVALLIEVLK